MIPKEVMGNLVKKGVMKRTAASDPVKQVAAASEASMKALREVAVSSAQGYSEAIKMAQVASEAQTGALLSGLRAMTDKMKASSPASYRLTVQRGPNGLIESVIARPLTEEK